MTHAPLGIYSETGTPFEEKSRQLVQSTACFYDETIEQRGRTFQRTGRRVNELERGLTRSGGGANILTRSVSSLGGVLGALGIAAVTHEIGRFAGWGSERQNVLQVLG